MSPRPFRRQAPQTPIDYKKPTENRGLRLLEDYMVGDSQGIAGLIECAVFDDGTRRVIFFFQGRVRGFERL